MLFGRPCCLPISDEQRLKRERRVAGDGEKVARESDRRRVAEISNMDAAAIHDHIRSTFTKRYVRPPSEVKRQETPV